MIKSKAYNFAEFIKYKGQTFELLALPLYLAGLRIWYIFQRIRIDNENGLAFVAIIH